MDDNQAVLSTKEAKIIHLFGEDYAVNLEWINKQDITGSAPKINKKLIKEVIPDEDFDLYLPYLGEDKMYAQIGFANSSHIDKGYKSLALALLTAKAGRWAGLFKISEEEYYLIFINDDLIDPDTDIIGPHDLVLGLLKEIMEENELTNDEVYVYTKSDSEAQNALKEFIDNSNKKAPKIKPINISLSHIHPIVYVIGLSILAGGGGYGYIHYDKVKEEEARADEERKAKMRAYMQEQQETEKKELQEKQEKLESLEEAKIAKYEQIFQDAKEQKPQPWNNMPKPSVFFNSCLDAMGHLPLFRSTWRLEQATCSSGSIVSIYKRGDIVDVGRFLYENPDAELDLTGEAATFTTPLVHEDNDYESSIANDYEEYRKAKYTLIGALQNKNVSYTFGEAVYNQETYTNPYGNINYSTNELRNATSQLSIKNQLTGGGTDSKPSANEIERRLNDSMTMEEIEQLTVDDLPPEYLSRLSEFYQKDWTTQTLILNSQVTINWLGSLLDEIQGMRMKRLEANISKSGKVEWTVEAPMYLKQNAMTQ